MTTTRGKFLATPSRGLSLLEVLLVIVVLGIVAAIALPRFGGSAGKAKANSCLVNQRNIELQAELWFRHKGIWPASNLSDIQSDPGYFPQGSVTCPVDGSAYEIDAVTGRVVGHAHSDLLN